MRVFVLMLSLLLGAPAAAAQAVSGGVEIVTAYSQNGRFRLKSVPFDNTFPSLRGQTSVYEQGSDSPLYTLERAFDAVAERSNNLVLSDDGEVIFYAVPWGADEARDGLRSVNLYRRGELFKSYTLSEITGCDEGREGGEEQARQRAEFERRLTLETIEGVYIPKDLGEALAELDKRLPEVDKNEMRALPSREEMIRHHLGLGTWMRNAWGLWNGSRLHKYFTALGVKHPESMSGVILYHYHDWLNGRRETWREWEKQQAARGDHR